jgi:hypothetical protein
MKTILPLILAAAWLGSPAVNSSAATILLRDTFDANTANTTDLNVDLARQTGSLAPISYTMASGPGHYGHQLQNVNAQNQLLVADFPNSTSSLNLNFNGANSAGGLRISFDVDSIPTVYGGTADNWGAINIGASQSDQMVNVNGGQAHFGILFRGAGTLQAFDGAAVVSPNPEPVYSTRPAGTTNHIDLVITDADGNPFDGVGNTIIEVFANGNPLPVWTFTKVGGYANNYINVQGSFRAHIDNLTITQLGPDRAPVVVNPSFEADSFQVWPGYVSQNGPITGWASLDNHGLNPVPSGGPFSDNGVIPDGTHVAFLQGDGPMSQVISGFTIGANYQIRYFENARTGGVPSSEVKIGGQTIVALHAVTPVGGANPYREIISDPFTATATAMQLSFIKSNPQGGDTTLLIDHVSIIAPGTPPSISVQPGDTIVALGDTLVLTVGAAGSAPLAYQWYFNGDAVVGGNAANLSILADFPDVAGDYYAVVSNSSGSITSRVAKVTVRAKVPGLFDTGVDSTGAALADGAVDPHYQLIVNADSASTEAFVHSSTIFPIVAGPWLANTATSKWISPRVDSSLAAGLARGNGTYVYRTTFDLTGLDKESVIITGGWAIDNTGVSIKVNDQPTGLVNNSGFGAATTFTISVANAALVDGVNTLDFEVQNVDATEGYTGLRVVGLRGTAELPGTAPSIEQQPQGGVAGTGESFTFTVLASGSSPLSYQWRKGSADISGATSASYTIANVQKSDAGDYTVRITNPAGNITSSTATLQVRDSVTLYNTGVDDSHVALGDGAVDGHYQIVVNPDSAMPDAYVENSAAFPIVAGPWVANNAGSKWIGPRFDTTGAAGATGAGGDYVYRTIVDLTGFDPATVTITGGWATDNEGLDILVNGQSTGLRNTTQSGALTPFTLNSGFLAGLNVIEFKLNNSAVGYTGLRVDQLRGLGDALPAGTAPFIVTQPQGASLAVGQVATFSVRANGSAPVEYQWYFGPDPIPGANSPTLTFPVEFTDVAGDYSVEVSNGFGLIRSQPARLVVLAEPVILTQPQSQVVAVGDAVTFSVSAIGEAPLTYQWLKGGQPIPGATEASYTIASAAIGDAGVYTVEISNFSGSATSDPATLTIAEVVPGLFNTGVGDDRIALPSGSVDPHWTIASSPDPAFPGPTAIVLNDVGFPIPPWLANDEVSKWISPQASQGTGNLEGDYIYRTTFSVDGFNATTVRVTGEWATDNGGLDILVNGVSSGQRNDGQFVTWTAFTLTTGFVPGVNTLDFKVNNAPPGVNPTGFRVRGIRAVAIRATGNQAPSFVKGPDVTVAEDAGAQTIPNWATSISAGPGESSQTVTFLVSTDNPSLFSAAPAIDASGTLTFTPAANATGQATVTVRLQDNGGTDNGGVDTSAPQTFTITVTPVNDCPTAAAQTITLNVNVPIPITLTGSDGDGGALTFTIAVPPAHGTLSGAAPNLTYTPAAGYCGTDQFTFTVSDGTCTSSPATISLNIACLNRPPVAQFEVTPLFAVEGLDYPTIIAGNGSNACVTLDGSATTDPDGDALEFAWLVDGSIVPVATGVIATTCLELGVHDITLVATDAGGADGTTTKRVEVITAGEALDLLISAINDLNVEGKNKRPFLATLKAAQASFDRGDLTPALNQLGALQNKLRAQLGRSHPEEATRLIRLAQAIANAVNPPAP